MRVVHVVPDLAPESGGPVTAVLGMTRALRAAGVEVRLFATSVGTPTVPDGVDVAIFPCRSRAWRWAPELGRELGEEAPKADLVHLHTLWSYPTLAASRAARRAHVPYIVRPCGMLDRWSMDQGAWKKRLYLSLIEDNTLDGAAAIHWTSEPEQRGAVRQGRRGFVLPLGLSPEILEARPERGAFGARFPQLANRPLVLFVGRLHAKKQPRLLIDAFAVARQRLPALALVLAGPATAQERHSLDGHVRARGLGPDVHFAGLLSGREVAEALAAAAVFVLPSLQENFGLAVGEAMAMGCPVIVSPQVGLSGVVRTQQAGLVVEPTVDALADAIVELLGDDARRTAMGENGRRFARGELSWSALAPRLIAHYDDLLGRSRGRSA